DQLAWPGIASLPGLPATAIPIGLSPEGLPVGVQIIGPWLEDRTPLKLAELIEREFGGFVPPPLFNDETMERKLMSKDMEELTALNRDYVASVQNCDVKRFDEILAPEFYCSNPDKTLVDRE